MKKLITLIVFLFINTFMIMAQDYPNWPADKPETDNIEASQSRETRLGNDILPQEIDMQDKMRTLITVMMENAAKDLHWKVTELSEYTNDNAMQGGGTPYNLRSPRGIDITFQFIVNNDSLQVWKNYQLDYNKRYSDNGMQSANNMAATQESPLYKQYQDSVNYYMNLYTTYTTAHQSEGAALFTKDKHPAYYQKKETEFINKMTAMQNQTQDNSGMDQMEDENKKITRRFRNNTVVQVHFQVNTFVGDVIDESLGPIESTSKPLQINNVEVARFYTIGKDETTLSLYKWNNAILMLLGNFHTSPVEDSKYLYDAGFNNNGQGDEHTPKKIKSDKVQDLSVGIVGRKNLIEKMMKFIDVDKLNSTIVKN